MLQRRKRALKIGNEPVHEEIHEGKDVTYRQRRIASGNRSFHGTEPIPEGFTGNLNCGTLFRTLSEPFLRSNVCVEGQRICVVHTRIMNINELIVSSGTRAEIFTILFGLGQRELHNRVIARRSNRSEAAVRQEHIRLAEIGLLCLRRSGNREYCSANRSHPCSKKDIHW